MYVPAIEMHRALTAHDLDVADAVEVYHDQQVVGIVDCSFDPEPSQSSRPMATVEPESASISQLQWVLAPEELVAFAVENDSMADLALVEVGHKAFVAAVGVSPVVILLPSSLLLSSQSLQFLLWSVVPIAVDSSRRRRYAETRSRSHFINIWILVYPSPRNPVQLLGNKWLYRVCICMKPLYKGRMNVASRVFQIGTLQNRYKNKPLNQNATCKFIVLCRWTKCC